MAASVSAKTPPHRSVSSCRVCDRRGSIVVKLEMQPDLALGCSFVLSHHEPRLN